jgi:hypothetical protein
MSSDSAFSTDLKGPIKKITVMKKDNSVEAMKLLLLCEKYAVFVMHCRGWTVNSVNEFYPKNDSLQGLNINGTKIMVRLRPPER